MKGYKKLLYIGALIIMIGCLTGCFKRKIEIKNITHVYFTFSNGYAMNSYTRYTLNYKDGKYEAEIKQYGEPEENLRKYTVEKKKVEELEKNLNETNIYKWKGFDKNDKNVLDGDSFSFNMWLGEGKEKKEIDAHGYMKWPVDYANIKGIICDWFDSIDVERPKDIDY